MAVKKKATKAAKESKPPAQPAVVQEVETSDPLIAGDAVIFIEDDLVTSHDALVQETFVHEAALSPTGHPSINLVYIDGETHAVVPVCNVPHLSLLNSPDDGKHWCYAWELEEQEEQVAS